MKKVERRIGRPAGYTFDCFFEEKRCAERGWPENISKWGWYSMAEVRDSIVLQWKYAERDKDPNYIHKVTSPPTFDPRNYVHLNRRIGERGETVLTWFIQYEEGILFVDRNPLACPFDDPDLYVPARWCDRVMLATRRFVKRAEVTECGEIIAVMFDDSREAGADFVTV